MLAKTAQVQYVSGDPDNSALYANPSIACTSGFAQIKSRVPNWVGISASYSNDVCFLNRGSAIVGTLPILGIYPELPAPRAPVLANSISGSSLAAVDVYRDNGQLIRFWKQGGGFMPQPGISLRLQQNEGGFTVIDDMDSVELYDTTGKLQTITSRSGVIQVLSYDSSGRLTTVTDSFGHRLVFTYNAESRVTSVERQ